MSHGVPNFDHLAEHSPEARDRIRRARERHRARVARHQAQTTETEQEGDEA